MSTSLLTVLRRPLGPDLTALGGILAFSLIAALVNAVALVAGIAPQWAFAAGWIVAFTVLVARQALRAPRGSRPWRAALVQLAFMSAITVTVTWSFGARIFQAAP